MKSERNNLADHAARCLTALGSYAMYDRRLSGVKCPADARARARRGCGARARLATAIARRTHRARSSAARRGRARLATGSVPENFFPARLVARPGAVRALGFACGRQRLHRPAPCAQGASRGRVVRSIAGATTLAGTNAVRRFSATARASRVGIIATTDGKPSARRATTYSLAGVGTEKHRRSLPAHRLELRRRAHPCFSRPKKIEETLRLAQTEAH